MSKQVETHHYQPDTSLRRDYSGSFPCRCGLPKRNQHHAEQPTDHEAKAAEARRLGERPEDDQKEAVKEI